MGRWPMTSRTAHVRADCWSQSLEVIYQCLPSAPLCERLLRGAFNTAEKAIDQSLFRNRKRLEAILAQIHDLSQAVAQALHALPKDRRQRRARA